MSIRLVAKILSAEAAQAASRTRSFLTKDPKHSMPISGTDTPLDRLRVGSSVGLDAFSADYILAESGGAFVHAPAKRLSCCAYGRIDYGDLRIHRFYLYDHDTTQVRILQVVTEDGKVDANEVKLFELLTEFTPQTPEEWDTWLEGDKENTALLGGLILKWEGVEYTRLWSIDDKGNGPDEIDPQDWREVIYRTAYGEPDVVTAQVMAYWRQIGESFEHVLVGSLHDQANGERWIEAYVGLVIDPHHLDVITGA